MTRRATTLIACLALAAGAGCGHDIQAGSYKFDEVPPEQSGFTFRHLR